jgi:catechol 2,3-dioxygenase-like lactoylglutathione lyase family enzyme
MDMVSVRYIVDDVDAAVDFYTGHLDFEVQMHPGPGFAMLQRGTLRLLLNSPGGGGGAGQAVSDETVPAPGGWNRFQIEVEDIDATVEQLKGQGARFCNEMITGQGGKQILLEDPAGNLIELFEPLER